MKKCDIEIRVGKNLKRLREDKGMTQDMLVAKLQILGCDITRSALSKVEIGKRHFYLDEIIAAKKVLDVPYEKIFDVSEKPSVEETADNPENAENAENTENAENKENVKKQPKKKKTKIKKQP